MRYALLLLVVLAGCAPDIVDTVDYTPALPEDIPDIYRDGAFSIKGLLANKDQYENKSVIVRGIVSFKYECPPCPRGVLCEPCTNDHIYLGDPIENITDNLPLFEHEIVVNIFKDRETYDSLKIGQEIVINVTVSGRGTGGVAARNGLFIYNNLISMHPI